MILTGLVASIATEKCGTAGRIVNLASDVCELALTYLLTIRSESREFNQVGCGFKLDKFVLQTLRSNIRCN